MSRNNDRRNARRQNNGGWQQTSSTNKVAAKATTMAGGEDPTQLTAVESFLRKGAANRLSDTPSACSLGELQTWILIFERRAQFRTVSVPRQGQTTCTSACWSTGRAKQKERPVRVRARNSGSRKAAVGAPGRGKARSSSSANTSRAARRGAAPMLPSGERSPSHGELRLD